MDKYDVLLNDINREVRIKKEKKFWRGKKWNKKQRAELEKQGEPPLKLNRIKSGQEIQREHMREEMGLASTEGLGITEENLKKLESDLEESISAKGGIFSEGVFYEDFSHFVSALIEKYFTKEEIE